MGFLTRLFAFGRPKCDVCGDSYGPLFTLGNQPGGYRCQRCGTKSCGPCGKAAGVAQGRMTFLCPRCGADDMEIFRA